MATKATLKDLRNGNVFTLGEIKSQILVKSDNLKETYCVVTEYTLGYVHEVFYNINELGNTMDIVRDYLNQKIQENADWIKRLQGGISDEEDDKMELDKSNPRYDIELERCNSNIKHKRSLIPVAQQKIDDFAKLKEQLEIKLG